MRGGSIVAQIARTFEFTYVQCWALCSQIYLLRNTDSKTSGLPNVDILRIVLALQLRPLGLLVLDDVFKHTLGSASLSLAALLALRTKSVG